MLKVEFADKAEANSIADWLDAKLRDALANCNDSIAICIPGGSTPFPIFAELVRRDLDWSRIAVWPGDDRIVPEDHQASNTGKIRKIFEPAGAKVISLLDEKEIPHFALVWLGMGGDGHIASLFPNTDPQVNDLLLVRRLTPDPLPPEAPFDRITLTIPALLNSGALMFTLGGSEEKRAVFDAAVAGENDLPIARLLSAADVHVTCFS
jgi:6-phosphogluconolactonase